MKGIIVEDCLDCPFSDIKDPDNNGGTLICELGKSIECEKEQLCKMIEGDYTIPDWCRLDDLQEVVEIAACDYGIMYRGNTKKRWKT